MNFGLLHSVDEQPEWLTYAHKLFQDFLTGYYACKKFERDCSKVAYFNCIEKCSTVS